VGKPFTSLAVLGGLAAAFLWFSAGCGGAVSNKSAGGQMACAADSGSPPPSCAPGGPGMTNCGTNGDDCCCASLEVSGGTFYRTYTNSGSGPTGEADPATISSFSLDKYLVTVGRFRQFVNAWNGGAGYTPPAGSGVHTYLNGDQGLANCGDPGTYETGWSTSWNGDIDPTTANLACWSPYNTWTDTAGSQENLPINCVTWWESYAFCIWDGGFLPSEAEWEYAAAGGSQQLEYPWGSTAPGTANQYAIYDSYYTENATYIAPVGYAASGAGLWGQLDMAGEVWEWNLDWSASYVDPCPDCANLSSNFYRVFRGGGFSSATSNLLPPYRYGGSPTARGPGIGFRCARTP
jgi:formylglycine-generating enzyme required for sulfatase activity